MNKTAVVYYSLSGITRKYAEVIAQSLQADLIEIKPVNEIKPDSIFRFVKILYMLAFKKNPELLPIDKDLSQYDFIIAASPVWAGAPAAPMRSFLMNHRKAPKNAFFLCCAEKAGRAADEMKSSYTGQNLISHKIFSTRTGISLTEAANWAEDLKKL